MAFRLVAPCMALLCVSCVGFVPYPASNQSFGDTADGVLAHGARLRDEGPGFVRARPGEDTRYGTERMIAVLERAAASVEDTYPGGAPLRVGDISAAGGGKHLRHGSHRAGRDVDLVFYLTDAEGRSVRGMSWIPFDRMGAVRELSAPEGRAPSNELFFFDEARNWHLIRTLLLDTDVQVQWIFCSHGVKARLLAYAAENEPNPDAILRAAWVLHQPSTGNPHADHFHVRIACSPEERAEGCRDRGPVWPWIRKLVDKPADRAGLPLNDEALLDALEEPLGA